MPVTVQLPGFQNHAAPIQGIASLAEAISNISSNSKKNDLVGAETQQKNLDFQTAQAQAQRNSDLIKAQGTPGTYESETAKGDVAAGLKTLVYKGIVRREDASPLLNAINDPKVTGLQVKQSFQSSPFYSKLADIIDANQKAQALMPLAQARMAAVDNQKDNITNKAVNEVVNDKQIQNQIQRIQGISRIKSQIDDMRQGKFVDTNQFLADINSEYSQALTGASNPALGKQEQTSYKTTAGVLANIKQQVTGDPSSINSPEIIKQVESQIDGLNKNWQQALGARAKSLQRSYRHNPDATQAMSDKIQELIGTYGEGGSYSGGTQSGGSYMPNQGEAMQEAKRRGLIK